MSTRKEKLLRILNEGITARPSDESLDQACGIWAFNDQVINSEMRGKLTNWDEGRKPSM